MVVAGCLGEGDAPPAGPDADDLGAGDSAGDPQASGNGSAVAPVAAPPAWTVGQSWSWRLTSGALEAPVDATTVVLAADGTTYDVGVPDVAQGAGVLPFHLVGLGPLSAACLCWQAHGLPVELVRFPLSDGQRFTADFWSAPGAEVAITAMEVAGPDGPEPGFRSVVSFSGGGTFLMADYSPQRGQFVRVASYFGGETPFAEAVLAGEGSGMAGIGFRAVGLARYNANAGDPASLAPQPLDVPAGSEVVLLGCFLPGDEGAYGAQLTTAGLPLACAGVSPGQTSYAGTYAAATPGPGLVVGVAGGESGVNVEVFAIDTTPPA